MLVVPNPSMSVCQSVWFVYGACNAMCAMSLQQLVGMPEVSKCVKGHVSVVSCELRRIEAKRAVKCERHNQGVHCARNRSLHVIRAL